MSVFAVALREPNDECFSRLKEHYSGSHYTLSKAFALVSCNDLAEEVAVNVGIKGDGQIEGISGVVFKLNGAYSGYTTRSIWEWLERNEADL